MTFFTGLTDEMYKLLRDLITGAVDLASRDSEAWSYGNGIDSNSDADAEMRNAVAHAHKSAVLAKMFREYGYTELAEVFGDFKEILDPTPDNARDSWKDQYNNEIGRRIAEWMEESGFTEEDYTEEELNQILDDLIKDAVDNGDLIGDPTQDSRTNGTDTPLNNENVPIDPNTGEVLDPKNSPTWTAPSNDWEGGSQPRDYNHPEVQPPSFWDETFEAVGYHIAEAMKLAGDLYDSGVDNLAALYVGLDYLAGKIQGLLDDALQGLQGLAAPFAESLQDLWDWIQSFGSPLVLDLDSDGIELVSLANSTLYWDIDEDGFAEHSGWVSPDDGFLAIDLNGDGIVTDHTELFGSTMTDGFTVLGQYDTNSDGVIDANDAQFGDLLVWQDVNQNGISDVGELYSLADLDIVSIDLNASQPSGLTNEGHQISHVSSYTVDDGVNGPQTHEIVDVWFEYDDTNSNFIGDYTLDLASLFVTTMRGYGTLPDLHVSASMDNDTSDPNSLMSLLQDFTATDFSDLFVDTDAVMLTVRDIMLRWAGVDGNDPLSRGGTVDARELEFLEAMMGQAYSQGGYNSDPILNAAEGVDLLFEYVTYQITGKLVAQAAGSALFNDGVYYNPASDTFEGFTAFKQDALDALVLQSNDANIVTDKTAFWISVINMIDSSVGVANLPAGELSALEAALVASDPTLSVQQLVDRIEWNIEDQLSWHVAGDDIVGTNNDDVYQGGIGDDQYSATYGNDTLSGGIGDDTLIGGFGNDVLNGQLGDDYLLGDGGDDIFHFNLGQGNDQIHDSTGTDKIVFGTGISAGDLSFTRVGADDLRIDIDPNVGAGSITLESHISGAVIETLEFSDASTVDMNALDLEYIGTSGDDSMSGVKVGIGGSGNDTIYGMGGNDTIYGYGPNETSYTTVNYLYGGEGDDTIYGDRGIDHLTGGIGDDTLQGGYGDDAYYFNYGDGDDSVYEVGGTDKIVFGAGITQQDVTLTRIGYDLSISVDSGLGGSVLVQWQYYSAGYALEQVEFSDGSIVNISDLDIHLYGSSANDYLTGSSGNDVIHGLEGNDTIYGYAGNDTYHMGLGNDTVQDVGGGDDTFVYTGGMDKIYQRDGGNDTLILDIDTTINDIAINQSGNHYNLVIDAGVNEVQLQWFFYNSYYPTETIEFQDGFVTSLIDFPSWQHGTSGVDTLNGTAGVDTIIGKDGNDVLSGLAGDDDIHGGSGNDTLYGGDGLDNLWGGTGADTFTFEGASAFNNVDVIGDFDLVEGDIVNVADLISGYDPLTDAIADFVQITDNGTNSTLSVDADGGADNFVQIATLNNVTGLTDEEALETSGNLIAA